MIRVTSLPSLEPGASGVWSWLFSEWSGWWELRSGTLRVMSRIRTTNWCALEPLTMWRWFGSSSIRKFAPTPISSLSSGLAMIRQPSIVRYLIFLCFLFLFGCVGSWIWVQFMFQFSVVFNYAHLIFLLGLIVAMDWRCLQFSVGLNDPIQGRMDTESIF